MRKIAHDRVGIAILALLLTWPTAAETEFPKKLFGVEVGLIFEVDQEYQLKGFSAGKFKGLSNKNDWLSFSREYNFSPAKELPAFPYLENGPHNNGHYHTSFYLQLYPVFERGQLISEDTKFTDLTWYVVSVHWDELSGVGTFGPTMDDMEAYYWADELCRSIALDLGREPSTESEFYEADVRSCTFEEDDRVLRVRSTGVGRELSLTDTSEAVTRLADQAEEVIRRSRIEEIRPYE